MKTKHLFTVCLLFLAGLLPLRAATTVNIPTTDGQYIDWNNCDLSNASVENDGANIGSTRSNTVATFTVSNTTAQDYVLTFKTGANGLTGEINVTLTNSSSETVFSTVVNIENTGSWTPSTLHNYLIDNLAAGTYTLTFATKSTTGSYAGNWGDLAFYSTVNYDNIPGTLSLAKGSYNGPKTENDNTNVGYVQNGGTASYSFINTTAGVYEMAMDICRYNQGGTMNIQITNEAGEAEVDYDYTIASDAPGSYTTNNIVLPGNLTTGVKTMTLSFSNGSSYICNYKAPTFTKKYEGIAAVSAVAITGQTVTTGTTSDWYCALPVTYDANTTFSVASTNGTIAVSAVDESSSAVSVTDNGNGTYTLATPTLTKTTTVTITLTPTTGYYAQQTTYTFKIFRIGEMSLTAVTVDGTAIDVLTTINNSPYSATYDACYTTAPTVAATQIDGAAGCVGDPVIDGNTYTYTISTAIEGTDIARNYTLILNNVHIYSATGSEETVDIKANGGTITDNTWTNGVYTLATTSLDSYNQYFKMNGNSYTLSVPSDVTVKQLIMKDCSNNYAGNDARLTAVTSTGATAYIPVDNKYYHSSEGAQHDIIVNIDDHAAGTDIVLSQAKSGQPMAWIQLTAVKQNPGTAPTKTAENVTIVSNHAVVAVTFDREIANDVTATINGNNVTAEGGAATLYFPVWDLAYSTNYTLTIAAEAATDNYGNSNASAIEIAVNVPAKSEVEMAVYDYVVSTADELKAAISAVDAANTSSSATRKIIFLKNGTYDLGTTGTATVQWINAHNVSLIGESREGVIICGNSSDISNPVLNIRYGSGQYLQDLTVRNTRDFDQSERAGVSVAVYGGNKAIFKNVAMQAQQDTQVTGERAYYSGCQFYGAVDFICGGGDHFYDECDFFITNSGYITAPSTSSANKWGYVMMNCTINKYVGSYNYEADGNFTLGRPWQGEPRNYWLNTTMNVKPSADGWSGMGTLKTHFYEYNSMDSNGTAIDLSVRKNSPTSTNTYTPVLTTEQAAKFTVKNVLGGTDSWLPTEECVTLSAPTLSMTGTTLSWDVIDDARCYVVFKNGQYLTNTTETTLNAADDGVYTVRAANLNGGMGETSNAVLKRAITAGKWSTIVLPFAMSENQLKSTFGDDVKVAGLTAGDDTSLTFSTVSSTNANQPYAIKVTADFTGALISNVTIENGTPEQSVGNWTFAGTYASSAEIPTGAYFFSANKLVKAGTGNTVKGTRAYLVNGNASAPVLNFIIDSETTGINDVKGKMSDVRSDIYNLNGQRIAQPAKGLYIVNGKKVVIK